MRLPSSIREQLLRAGTDYLNAKSVGPDQRTASAAFLVVACEALKPTGGRYNKLNIYNVIESLLGPNEAKRLRELSVHPQRVRHGHLHRGELVAGELLSMLVRDHFMDPSFDEMLTELSAISRMCLIEWLRCGGSYSVVRLPCATPTQAARMKPSGPNPTRG